MRHIRVGAVAREVVVDRAGRSAGPLFVARREAARGLVHDEVNQRLCSRRTAGAVAMPRRVTSNEPARNIACRADRCNCAPRGEGIERSSDAGIEENRMEETQTPTRPEPSDIVQLKNDLTTTVPSITILDLQTWRGTRTHFLLGGEWRDVVRTWVGGEIRDTKTPPLHSSNVFFLTKPSSFQD